MNTPELRFRTELAKVNAGRQYHIAYGEVIPSLASDDEPLIIGRADYNIATDISSAYDRVAYLNTLSSIQGAIKGKLLKTLGPSEHAIYADTMARVNSDMTLVLPIRPGAKMIEALVTELLPEDVHYLKIKVAEDAQMALENYYMWVGAQLKENGHILHTFYYGGHGYNDGVCYQIRD